MEKITQTTLVLYTQDFKYCLFDYSNNLFSLVQEQCEELNDNYCPFLSIARHIVTKISHNFSINMMQNIVTSTSNQNININDHYSMSVVYHQWIDLLTEAYQCDEYSKNHTIYMQQIINPDEFLQNMKTIGVDCILLSQTQIQEQQNSDIIDEQTQNIFNKIQMDHQIKQQLQLKNSPPSKENTYLFFLHNKTTYLQMLQNGRSPMPTKAFYYGIYKKDYQKWYTYNAALQEYPSNEILKNVKGILMPGSTASAYEEIEWIDKYKKLIYNIYHNYKEIRILGICFGEQILAHTLNGKCDIVQERKKNKRYYNSGVQQLYFSEQFFEIPFVKSLNLQKKIFNISKAHGDIVVNIDQTKFELIGSSDKYIIEAFIDKIVDKSQNPRILCIQGHPEFSSEWLIMNNAQQYSFNCNISLNDAIQEIRKERQIPDDSQQLRQICDSFLLY